MLLSGAAGSDLEVTNIEYDESLGHIGGDLKVMRW